MSFKCRKRGVRRLVACLAVTFAACTLTDEALGSGAWRQSSIWNDGQAEFCAYEIDWFRYGTIFPGRALLIAVKEPWAPDLAVKADTPRSDGFEVIKLNHVRDVATGIYTYHQMASAFLRRDSGALEKLAVTSSEGCGISTAQVANGILETRSYFDGQGERSAGYPEESIPADALALALRDFVSGPLPDSILVFPSLMTGRFPKLEAGSFELARENGSREVPAGDYETIELELTGRSERMRFAFSKKPPHRLVFHEHSDGTTYRLAKCERIPYWQMNGPGGENWLPPEVR